MLLFFSSLLFLPSLFDIHSSFAYCRMALGGSLLALRKDIWARANKLLRVQRTAAAQTMYYQPSNIVPLRSIAPTAVVGTPYGAYVNQYVSELQAWCRASDEAVVATQKQLQRLAAERERTKYLFRRQLLLFIPITAVAPFFLREYVDRICAERTHEFLRKHAEERCSLKWIAI